MTIDSVLKTQFGDQILSVEQTYDIPTVTIKKDSIIPVLKFLNEAPELQYQFLTDLCGVHYPDAKGAELGVVYHVHSLQLKKRLRIKAFAPIEAPHFPTATVLYESANWMERETYDFYGIIFDGHPNLKRILNMDDLGYFPMRKEYPMEDTTRDDKADAMFGR